MDFVLRTEERYAAMYDLTPMSEQTPVSEGITNFLEKRERGTKGLNPVGILFKWCEKYSYID